MRLHLGQCKMWLLFLMSKFFVLLQLLCEGTGNPLEKGLSRKSHEGSRLKCKSRLPETWGSADPQSTM